MNVSPDEGSKMSQSFCADAPITASQSTLTSHVRQQSSRRFLLVGHSHSNAIEAGLKAAPKGTLSYRHIHLSITDKYLKLRNAGISADELNDKTMSIIVRELKSLAGYDGLLPKQEVPGFIAAHDIHLLLSIRGVVHVLSGLVQPERPYDFALRNEPDLPFDSAAELVPFGAMWDSYRERLNGTFEVMARIAKLAQKNVFVLAFPPPVEDDTFMRTRLGRFFTERYAADFKIVSSALRYKLWRLCIELYEQHCQDLGVTFVMPPEETMVDSKFLNPKAYHTDAVHANDWFGERMVDKVLKMVAA
jgi:hypothetical protein